MKTWETPGLLRDKEERHQITRARERGFLHLRGHDARCRRLSQAWLLDRLSCDLPLVESSAHFSVQPREGYIFINVELRGSWWMTQRLKRALEGQVREDESMVIEGDGFRLTGGRHRDLVPRSVELLELLHACRPVESERYDHPPRLVEGCFVCVNSYGFEEELIEGQSYFLREIAGQEGHVVVYIPGCSPLVGIHLDRFDH